MSRLQIPNPLRLSILWVGYLLARFGLVDRERAKRTTDLAWPRIVTGLARMSKNAVDVAMVGIAVGPAAIAGVGFAGPFWGLAFAFGGGVAGGTIALVSQRYGAGAYDELGDAVRSSVLLVLVVTLPVAVVMATIPGFFISIITDSEAILREGSAYLQVVAFGIPFAGLNLIGSRTFVGMDDAWTPMVIRASGAVVNIVLSAILIFGLGMGVVGAALGTVLANVAVALLFITGLIAGGLPLMGRFPTAIDPMGSYVNREMIHSLIEIGLPVLGTSLVWTLAEVPLLSIVDLFGEDISAAYVIARRIAALMNVPGWGFGLAASSLVGQQLGAGDESLAETYGREIIRHSVAVYVFGAAAVFIFAEPIVSLFLSEPPDATFDAAVAFVRVASVAIIFQGLSGSAAGALNAAGDTRWPFYSQALGMFGLAIPVAYIGAVTPLGVVGIYLAFFAETSVPSAINYHRFSTGKWKAISREYRPDTSLAD